MSFRRDSYTILRIGTLLTGSITVDRSPILYINQNPVKFIKIYGVITDKTMEEGGSQSGYLFKIDDGTGSLWAKFSGFKAESLNKWDFVRIIGFINLDTSDGKKYEITVNAETVFKETDKIWELVHILESKRSKKRNKSSGSAKPTQKEYKPENIDPEQETIDETSNNDEKISENKVTESLGSKIEKILRENDSGNGVEFSTILSLIGGVNESEVDDILFELAYEGKVYQPRPDFYKIMD